MKAILINTELKVITQVEYSGHYTHIYELCGWSTFDCVHPYSDACLFVDDNGLYANNQTYFDIKTEDGQSWRMAGTALMLGQGDEGESTECPYSVEQVNEMVTWSPEGTHVEPEAFVFTAFQ